MPNYEIHVDFAAEDWDAAEDVLRSVDAVLREKDLKPDSSNLHRLYLRDTAVEPAQRWSA